MQIHLTFPLKLLRTPPGPEVKPGSWSSDPAHFQMLSNVCSSSEIWCTQAEDKGGDSDLPVPVLSWCPPQASPCPYRSSPAPRSLSKHMQSEGTVLPIGGGRGSSSFTFPVPHWSHSMPLSCLTLKRLPAWLCTCFLVQRTSSPSLKNLDKKGSRSAGPWSSGTQDV